MFYYFLILSDTCGRKEGWYLIKAENSSAYRGKQVGFKPMTYLEAMSLIRCMCATTNKLAYVRCKNGYGNLGRVKFIAPDDLMDYDLHYPG